MLLDYSHNEYNGAPDRQKRHQQGGRQDTRELNIRDCN